MQTKKEQKVKSTVSFPTSTKWDLTIEEWHKGITSQGYLRQVYKKDGRVYIKKTIPENDNYIKSLIAGLNESHSESSETTTLIKGSNTINEEAFTKSFKDQRLAIIDFEGLFFYHYAQVLSSIKASYENKLDKDLKQLHLDLGLSKRDQQVYSQILAEINSKEHIKSGLSDTMDNVFKNFLNAYTAKINSTFTTSVQQSIKDDSSVDVSKLNGLLNDAISPLKTELDQELEQRLKPNSIPTSAGKFRETTSAFGAPVTDVTETRLENGSTFIEKIESTTITAHDKKNGPAVSKVTMAIKQEDGSETVVFEGYRTSHLVSKPTKSGYAPYISAAVTVAAIIGVGVSFGFPPLGIALVAVGATLLVGIAVNARIIAKKEEKNILKTKNIIKQFMANSDSEKPMIYNLLTSTHASEYSLVGMYDAVSNKQTSRLKTLAIAQYEFNTDPKDREIKDMFFVLNTPTNTFGREISLTEFPENKDAMHLVAQSNLISLAILLYGHENEYVIKMVKAYKNLDSGVFVKAYDNLKTIDTSSYAFSEDLKIAYAQEFILARFKDDSAAKHQFAKDTASYVGILSQGKAHLIIGCKSGNERTGGILGRIATFISSAFWDRHSSDQKNNTYDTAKDFDLNKEYNDKGCNSSSVTTISRHDQGSDPKTEAKSEVKLSFKNLKKWLFQNHDTNKTESIENTNIQTHGVAKLQAHKDRSFKK